MRVKHVTRKARMALPSREAMLVGLRDIDAVEAAQARLHQAGSARSRWNDKQLLEWVLKFARREESPAALNRDDRVALGYDLRVLAAAVGKGWAFRRRSGPLSDRDLTRIHDAIHRGLAAVKASAASELGVSLPDPRVGWRLPPHRVRLLRMPTMDEDAKTVMVATYEAADEAAAIIVIVGQFVLRMSPRWRTCPCPKHEDFVPKRKNQIYYDPKICGNLVRQRRWYHKHYRASARRLKRGRRRAARMKP